MGLAKVPLDGCQQILAAGVFDHDAADATQAGHGFNLLWSLVVEGTSTGRRAHRPVAPTLQAADNQSMFVGRENELALLVGRLGEGKLVAILGEAGVGKTTLVRAAAERGGWRLVEAGGLATLSWIPYLPLKRAFGHEFEGDAAYVGATAEVELGDAVLFVDDLQWADTLTASLLPLLSGRIRLVATLRRGDSGTSAALEAVTAAGAELLPLEPLPEAEAEALARSLHPGLSPAATKRLVERSGGNPFLLEQLAATGEPSDDLRLAVAARVRALTPVGHDAIAALALLGRPAAPQLLGPGAAEIIAAGLATAAGEVTIRHALLAEATTEMLADDERRRFHSGLAAALDDPGEAARHHAAAGERDQAFEKAMLAAERSERLGERAAHLGLAASCADGPAADELRLRAAVALTEAGDEARAEALLADLEFDDPLMRAEACLVRWRARTTAVDYSAARAALEEGLTLARGTGSDIEIRLALAEVSTVRVNDNDAARALPMARQALELARSTGSWEARARHQLASALLLLGDPEWEAEFSTALARARREQDYATEFAAANNLTLAYVLDGRVDDAARIAKKTLARSSELRIATSERRSRAWLVEVEWHRGLFRRAVESGEELLGEHLNEATVTLARLFFGKSLIAVGRYDEARQLARLMRESAPEYGPDAKGAAEESIDPVAILAEAELWSGRPRQALDQLDECFARFGERDHPHGFAPLHVMRAWACFDLGQEIVYPALQWLPRLYEAAPTELEGVVKLAAGDGTGAARLFERAAEAWRGRQAAGEIRCHWAYGEALRLASDSAAVEQLRSAEERALDTEYAPMLGRIHRSLRLAGVRRSAARSQGKRGLTGREREVLELVGAGLSNVEIARRLGIGRPSVVRLIRSASQKLGARTRTQAAVLAAPE